MNTLFVMMRRVVTKVACDKIVDRVHCVVRGAELVLRVQARMMIVGSPRGDQQSGKHRKGENHKARNRVSSG